LKAINHHLGLPVIALDSSERVGDLIRFVTDQVSGQIVAIAVSRKWYAEPAGVPFADCTAFGQNVILVSSLEALKPLSQMEAVRLHLEASNDARQRTAITENGRLLGTVTDEAFDETSGMVTGYRLDVFGETGRARSVYVSRDSFVTSSATVAILRDDVLETAVLSLDDLASSITSARPATDDGTPSVDPQAPAPTPEPHAPSASPRSDDPVTQVPASALARDEEEEASTQPETTSPEALEAQERVMAVLSVGKTAHKAVHGDNGTVIVEAGALITQEIAELARIAGRLYEVWVSSQG
jgi:uncharacterized protein YrrD